MTVPLTTAPPQSLSRDGADIQSKLQLHEVTEILYDTTSRWKRVSPFLCEKKDVGSRQRSRSDVLLEAIEDGSDVRTLGQPGVDQYMG